MRNFLKKTPFEKLFFILFLLGIFLRFLISGRIYYWSNYLFFFWFSFLYLLGLLLRTKELKLHPILKLGWFLFLGGIIISLPFGIHPLLTAREMVIFLNYFFIFLGATIFLNKENLKILIWVIIIGAFFNALFGLRQYLGGLEATLQMANAPDLMALEKIRLKRIFGFTFSPDFFAAQTACALVLLLGTFFWLTREENKIVRNILFGLLSLLFFLALFLTRSFGGILSWAIGMVSLILFNWGKKLSGKRLIALLVGGGLLIFLIFTFFIYQRRESFFKSETNPIVLRLLNFKSGILVWKEKPLTGVGLGNFWIAYPRYRPPRGNEIRYVHNNFIQLLAEAGPISSLGLCLIVLYLFLGFRRLFFQSEPAVVGVWSALAVLWSHWLWDFGLYVPELAGLFFVLLAGWALLQKNEEKNLSRAYLVILGLLLGLLWLANGWLFQQERMERKAKYYLEKGELEPARKYARRALKLIPADDFAYGILARLEQIQGGNENKVVKLYQMAISLNPRFAFWYKELGDYYLRKGKLEQAEKEYQKALELYPYKLDFLIQLARVYRLKGRLSRAEKYARRALQVSGEHRLAYWELVWIYHAKGEQDKLIETLKILSQQFQDQQAGRLLRKLSNEPD